MRKIATLASAVLFTLAALHVQAEPAPRTLADMIRAGRVSLPYSRSYITEENFPVKTERFMTKGVEVIRFGRAVSTVEALADLDRRGYRPATIEALLAYAAQAWNGKDRVLALGSSLVVPGGDRGVPSLYADAGRRKLDLFWILHGSRWSEDRLFLVVRK